MPYTRMAIPLCYIATGEGHVMLQENMKKYLKRGIIVAALLSLIGIVHIHLRSTSPLYNFFLSPSDLYANLAESDFDLSSQNMESVLKFKPKYPGNHWAAILVEQPPNALKKYQSDFEVQVQIIDKSGILFEYMASDSSFWFYGGQNRSGFSLVQFKLPRDLPLGKPLNLRAKVIRASKGFSKKYGKQKLIVSKYSDE